MRAEVVADSGVDTEDGLSGRSSEVDDTVGETNTLGDDGTLVSLDRAVLVTRETFAIGVGVAAAVIAAVAAGLVVVALLEDKIGIVDVERKRFFGRSDKVELLNPDLRSLSGRTSDGL